MKAPIKNLAKAIIKNYENTPLKASANSFYTKDELQHLGFKSLGENVKISRFARFYGVEHISIGDNVRIDDFVVLSGNISIGSFVHLGIYSSIIGGSYKDIGVFIGDFCGLSSYSQIFATSDDFYGGYLVGPCVLDRFRNIKAKSVFLTRHCHIGSHSLVFPGARFLLGSSLGAMSLTMGRSLKEWSYYFGNPARKIFDIDSASVKTKEIQLLKALGGGQRQNNRKFCAIWRDRFCIFSFYRLFWLFFSCFCVSCFFISWLLSFCSSTSYFLLASFFLSCKLLFYFLLFYFCILLCIFYFANSHNQAFCFKCLLMAMPYIIFKETP